MANSQNQNPVYEELEQSVFSALETYSNVHRGIGHNSMVTTHLYEQAREIVLEYLSLDKNKYVVLFCSPRRAELLSQQLKPGCFKILSSQDIGFSIGVRAIAVKKNALPTGHPLETGGGTTKLVSKDWVLWAKAPDRFEAGTPSIINIIAFAKTLKLIQKYGKEAFADSGFEPKSVEDILYHDQLEGYQGKELLDELRKTLIGRHKEVPTSEHSKSFINLDNSASTPTFQPVWDTFRLCWREKGPAQQELSKEVKAICAKQLGAPLSAYDFIFTSNTTEAINLAAKNLSLDHDEKTGTVVLNTLMEHSSNDLPWRMVPNSSLLRLSVDADGFINLNELETVLNDHNHKGQNGNKRIRLVAISGASNVLGSCNDLKEISRIVHRYGAHLLVDGAQLIAHRMVDMEAYGIDYLSFSAHKIYAPFGCGVLVARKGLLKFTPSELELIQNSGEENTAGIAALGKAFVLLQKIGMNVIEEEEKRLTEKVLQGMAWIPGIIIHGIKTADHPSFNQKLGVIVFDLKGMMANKVAEKLALNHGIGVRYGCHCAHIILKHTLNVGPRLERFQKILVTMFPKVQLPGLTRISLGIGNTDEEIDCLIRSLNLMAGKNNTINSSKTNGKPVLTKQEVKRQMNEFVANSSLKVYS
ncbi:MAG: aminotransferase class V-fold PLP-dependent enzyme [Bacteroidales bacterium]|nr:aminotransferase class V-fold PLP-dependent enzyme [Bacteroidales bacterium]MCF8455727.1 aminotransferase class V-fold PLP-dependent enzyme [Bacteroidales bacterium]